jgi:hypothetical protein
MHDGVYSWYKTDKVKAYGAQRAVGGWGFQIPWHRHLKVVRCEPYAPAVFTPRSIMVLILRGWVDPGYTELSDATEKIPIDTTGDRSRDLPTRSAVP